MQERPRNNEIFNIRFYEISRKFICLYFKLLCNNFIIHLESLFFGVPDLHKATNLAHETQSSQTVGQTDNIKLNLCYSALERTEDQTACFSLLSPVSGVIDYKVITLLFFSVPHVD